MAPFLLAGAAPAAASFRVRPFRARSRPRFRCWCGRTSGRF